MSVERRSRSANTGTAIGRIYSASKTKEIRLASRCAWWLGCILGFPGLLLSSPLLVSLAACFIPLGFVLDDLAQLSLRRITVMTAYCGAAAITAFTNTIAILSANTASRSSYYLYVAEGYVFVAMCLWLSAAVIPPLAFRMAQRSRIFGILRSCLPRVSGEIGDNQLAILGMLAGMGAVSIHALGIQLGAGTITILVFLVPTFVVFVLARAGAERSVRGALLVALVVAVLESMRAALFGYLRGDVAAPFVAFIAGTLIGARSLRPLRSRIFLPVYGAALLFVMYFGAFGAIRSHSPGGLARIQAIQRFDELSQEVPDAGHQTVLSRLTTINQLSQIGRVAREEGLYHGQTLTYLGFAFIPRFLWPNKPTIAVGAWWALHLGLANVSSDGRILNSINMTIPGELYLNFGWLGVMLGCSIVGLLLALLWHTTDFWGRSQNVLGTAFGFYLIWPWVGFTLGADLQILVTLIAVYLLFVTLSICMSLFQRSTSTSRGLRRNQHHVMPEAT